MQPRLNERIVGAAVLVIIAVIFIPMILTGPVDTAVIKETNIPPRPDDHSQSKLVPLLDKTQDIENTDNQSTDAIADQESSMLESELNADQTDSMKLAMPDTISAPEKINLDDKQLTETIDAQTQVVTSDKTVGLSAWIVQLGSFSSQENAEKLNKDLRKTGFAAFVEPIKNNGKVVYRVRVGPELLKADAEKMLASIKTKMKLDGIVLSYP
ncbi:MAG: SPOR domain-containing protein [Pseudomonadota bacterium]